MSSFRLTGAAAWVRICLDTQTAKSMSALFLIVLLVPAAIFGGLILASLLTNFFNRNNELAQGMENEIRNREIMARQVEEHANDNQRAMEDAYGLAYDQELELLLHHQRFEDALGYIEERRRLAFEQGDSAREELYERTRRSIEAELAGGSDLWRR